MIETELGASSATSVTREAALTSSTGTRFASMCAWLSAVTSMCCRANETLSGDGHVVNTDGEGQRRRIQPSLPSVDRHDGVFPLRRHEQRSGQGREIHDDGLRRARADEHRHGLRLVAAADANSVWRPGAVAARHGIVTSRGRVVVQTDLGAAGPPSTRRVRRSA